MMFEYKVFIGYPSEIGQAINVSSKEGWRVHSFESIDVNQVVVLMERLVQEHKEADVSKTEVGAMAIKG